MNDDEKRLAILDFFERWEGVASTKANLAGVECETFEQLLVRLELTDKEASRIMRGHREVLLRRVYELEAQVDMHRVKLIGLDTVISVRDSLSEIHTLGPKGAVDLIEARLPALFASCYPRRFEIPGGFANPKRLAVVAFWAMWEGSELNGHPSVRPANTHCVKTVSALIEKQVPTYFVSRTIMHALINTDLPKDFALADMPWPLDAMLFVVPEGTLVSEHGDITLLAIAKCTAREYSCAWMNWGTAQSEITIQSATHSGPDAACILATTDSGHVFQWECQIDATSIHDAAKVSLMSGELSRIGTGSVAESANPEQEQFASNDLPRAAFQFILAMLACPEMIEAGVIVRHASKKKGKARSEIWSPNFFGKAYRRYEAILGESDTPQHKRVHWRRGHFRHQRFGAGNTGIRVIWIQPMLIGKDRIAA